MEMSNYFSALSWVSAESKVSNICAYIIIDRGGVAAILEAMRW